MLRSRSFVDAAQVKLKKRPWAVRGTLALRVDMRLAAAVHLRHETCRDICLPGICSRFLRSDVAGCLDGVFSRNLDEGLHGVLPRMGVLEPLGVLVVCQAGLLLRCVSQAADRCRAGTLSCRFSWRSPHTFWRAGGGIVMPGSRRLSDLGTGSFWCLLLTVS